MRVVVILLILLLSAHLLRGQSVGDYRSVATGNWNTNTTWQTYNGASWIAAPTAPNALTAGIVTVQAAHTVTVSSSTIVDRVVIDGKVVVNPGSTLTFPVTPSPAVITIDNGGILDVSGGITQVAASKIFVLSGGTLVGRQNSTITGSTASNLSFASNATYQHAFVSTAGAIPLASWDPASTVLFNSTTVTYTAAPANLGQNFGNVTFNLSGTGTLLLNGALSNVAGNLIVAPTNTKVFSFASGTSYTLNIGGDLDIGAGTMTVNTASTTTINVQGSYSQTAGNLILTSGTATLTFNLKKNFSRTGGTISKSGSGACTLVFNGTTQAFLNNAASPIGGLDFSVASGSTLDLGTWPMNGSGKLTVNAGATLQSGSTNNTATGALGGNLVLSGTKTFSTPCTIIYHNPSNSTVFLGTLHPTGTGITTIINNTGTVALAPNPSGYTILGDIFLQNGNFDISSGNITLGGVLTPNGNFLVANTSTSLTITDAGSSAPFGLAITGTSQIGSLTLNGSRTVNMQSDLQIGNSLTMTLGDLELNAFTLDIQGTITQTGGTITSGSTSGFTVSDEQSLGAALPAGIQIAGGVIGSLTINRAATNLVISSPIIASNLFILNGTFTPGPSFKIANGGKITVADGTLASVVTPVGTYNVEYTGFNAINTALELPTSGTTLNSLTNSNSASVTLTTAAVVNGDLTLNSGTLFSNGFTLTLNGDLISNAASDFMTSAGAMGMFVFNGASTAAGIVAPQFGNVVVNASKSVDLNLAVNVGGDFTVDGLLAANQSTVLFNGTIDQNIKRTISTGVVPFYQLEIYKKLGVVNILDSATVEGAIRIDTANTLNAGTNFLKLLSTAARTARVSALPVGAVINGSVIVQRYMSEGSSTRAYRYVATPVTNTTVADWQNEVAITGTFSDPSTGAGIVSANPSFFYYDETKVGSNTSLEERYVAYPTSGLAASAPLVNGRGYALYDRSFGAVVFDSRGTLQQQSVAVPVTAQSAAGIFDGWNLIGNPYPSPVVFNKVILSPGIGNAVYITDNTSISGTDKIVYVGGVAMPPTYDGTIDSHQAFWVHTSANGTVTFNESDKIGSLDSLSQFYRSSPIDNLLRITLTGENAVDATAIRFLDAATDSFDQPFDALKFPDASLNFASVLPDGRSLVINTLSSLNCSRSVPLSIRNVTAGSYSISSSGIGSFGSDVDLSIIDTATGSSFDLRSSGSYSFTLAEGDLSAAAHRFILQIGKTRILTDLAVVNSAICFKDSVATVTVQKTQPELQYKITWKGSDVSGWMTGTGNDLSFRLPAKNLAVGENVFAVLLQNTCNFDTLKNAPVVTKLSQPTISATTDGVACLTGTATLLAKGANPGENYNWYKSASSSAPFQTTAQGILNVIGVTEDAAFFVSVADSIGCPGERVKVNVTAVDSITLIRQGDVLVSNYESGNVWMLNGTQLPGSSGTMTITQTGTYSVEVTKDGCTTRASSVEVITGLENPDSHIYVYPNPTKGKIAVYLGNIVGISACVDILSMAGVAVYENCFDVQGAEPVLISAESFTAGMYLVRIRMSNGTIIRKVIKE